MTAAPNFSPNRALGTAVAQTLADVTGAQATDAPLVGARCAEYLRRLGYRITLASDEHTIELVKLPEQLLPTELRRRSDRA